MRSAKSLELNESAVDNWLKEGSFTGAQMATLKNSNPET